MFEIQLVWAWLQTAVHQAQTEPERERGDIVQTSIIVGLFAAAAIIIVGILVAKANDAAQKVKTQ